MSVKVPDRKESKVEFDQTYFKVYDDAMKLIQNHLGADKTERAKNKSYIAVMSNQILNSVTELGKYIRIANSIYPKYKTELEERRLFQDKAIGLCYDILTKYQLVMTYLKVPGNKHVNEIKRSERRTNGRICNHFSRRNRNNRHIKRWGL